MGRSNSWPRRVVSRHRYGRQWMAPRLSRRPRQLVPERKGTAAHARGLGGNQHLGLWLASDCLGRLDHADPLAIKVVQIQEHEAPHLLALLEQAQHTWPPTVGLVVWWWIGLMWTARRSTPSPNRDYLDASGQVQSSGPATAVALSAEGQLQERQETVSHGQGRTATQETLRTRRSCARHSHLGEHVRRRRKPRAWPLPSGQRSTPS